MKMFRVFILSMISMLLLCAVANSDDKPKTTAKAEAIAKTEVIQDSSAETITDTAAAAQEQSNKIVAYYLHGTRRCVTCKKLEAYSKEAIESKFEKELKSGVLEFKPVNFDEEENAHYIKDYALYTKSLVICDYNNGKQVKWKNLEKIWELVNDKEKYIKYVQDEINAYLNEGPIE